MLKMSSLCWFCQQPLAIAQHSICSVCLRQLPALPFCCPRCGLPAATENSECQTCRHSPPWWQHLIAVSDYVFPLKRIISQLKYDGEEKYAPMLARLLLMAWLNARRKRLLKRPDALIIVPLHSMRHWRRGFNQLDRMAKLLARWTHCRYRPDFITRHRATTAQQRLSAAQRRDNLSNAFSCNSDVRGLHVALLDDIVTTGSTVAEISRLLLNHGAASVQVWCVCRTLKRTLKKTVNPAYDI